jgi:hypothetical protein
MLIISVDIFAICVALYSLVDEIAVRYSQSIMGYIR